MRWCCLEKPPTGWARSAALDGDGTVFAPAAIAGTEEAVLLSATWDGVTILMDCGHPYLPTGWLAGEYPEIADICTKIETRVRAHFAGGRGGNGARLTRR
jgi:hypothetical protein